MPEKSQKMKKVSETLYEIPASGRMRVPARIYASEKILPDILKDNAPQQAANVACLPGIVDYSLAMPDIHWGYGFPIGGVAAFDLDDGVISPGGVGYDINCGVRLLRTSINRKELGTNIKSVTESLYRAIPAGVGVSGPLKLARAEQEAVLIHGAHWAVKQGYGRREDLQVIEETGRLEAADPKAVSERALQRGRSQIGTLGSGNHFVELGYVDKVYDEKAASKLGLNADSVTVIIHTGSRGFGHQVCDDFIRVMLRASEKYGIELPDRQLCCAPVRSPEGRKYLAAMACAVNFAFCNRQMITHWVRETLEKQYPGIEIRVVYEVAHNIAKIESHRLEDSTAELCVHRKGATRALPPQHPDLPAEYRDIGQPVLIPGDMGRCSYVLLGTDRAAAETFASTCHGAGRVLSRKQAIKRARGRSIHRELEERGIIIRATSKSTLAEEMSEAYKDVSEVVETVVRAGLSKKVVKLKPLGVIKG